MENVQEAQIVVEKQPLEVLFDKLQAQASVKRDYILPAGHMRYEGGLLYVGQDSYLPTDIFHAQVSQKLEIPKGYYDRMKSVLPELLENNINMWLSKKERTQYLLRTFGYEDQAICRALLSNKYNIIDNFDVLLTALDAIKKMGIHVEIVKADVTDKRMYLHVIAPEIHTAATDLLDGYLENRSTAIVDKGIVSGMVISNSEIGMGQFEISARAQILRCKNGLHDRNAAFKRRHLGAKLDEGEIEWSTNTRNKNFELIQAQVQDAVKLYLSQDYLGQLTTRLRSAKHVQIEHPVEAVTLLSNELQVSEEHKNNILKYFLQDGDQSTMGLMNAVTRETQHMNPDMQYDIESQVFNLLPGLKNFDKPLSAN